MPAGNRLDLTRRGDVVRRGSGAELERSGGRFISGPGRPDRHGVGPDLGSLPAGFPAYQGSTPAQEAATGPASAVLAVQGVAARTVADWMQSKLELASYSTEALSGPLEDGSFVLDSTRTSAWLPGPGLDRAARRSDDGDRPVRGELPQALNDNGA